MKKLMAYVISFGLVLLGMSPVLAAGQLADDTAPLYKMTSPEFSRLNTEQVSIPAPAGSSLLGDDDLESVRGEWGWAVAGAIVGAYKAVKSCDNCSLAGKVAAGFTGAVVGATVGAFAAAGAMVSEVASAVAGTVAGIAGNYAVDVSVRNIKKATGR